MNCKLLYNGDSFLIKINNIDMDSTTTSGKVLDNFVKENVKLKKF